MFAGSGPHMHLEGRDSCKDNTAGHTQSKSFLKCFDGFLAQVLKDLIGQR